MLRAASACSTHKTSSVTIIYHHHCIILLCQVANLVNLSDDTIHGKHTVGCNQPSADALYFLHDFLMIMHAIVRISIPGSFAKPDAIDDGSMIELVRNDCILFIQKRFKYPSVCIEGGSIQESIFCSEPGSDF